MASFELGEDIRNESREAQDQIWRDAITDGRVNLSHREVALAHSASFRKAIDFFRTVEILVQSMNNLRNKHPISTIQPELLKNIVEFLLRGHSKLVFSSLKRLNQQQSFFSRKSQSPFQIFVRKRPLLPFEIDAGGYDTCDVSESRKMIHVHDGIIARSGRRITMNHITYVADKVVDVHDCETEFFMNSMGPLLSNALHRKGDGTFLCFGQTGTGKTYTLKGALKFIAQQTLGKIICISFFEIHSKTSLDLLNEGKPLLVLSDQQGNTRIKGITTHLVNNQFSNSIEYLNEFDSLFAEETLLELFEKALKLRWSKVTERNENSSRSHAVCHLKFLDSTIDLTVLKALKESSFLSFDQISGDTITLVDLAGSERNYETTKMTAALHRESAAINLSLMTLKDCFRAYYQIANDSMLQKDSVSSLSNLNRFIPFRASLLTRVLKHCFANNVKKTENESCDSYLSPKTVIVAAISPSPIDIDHTINTLDHVIPMSPSLESMKSEDVIDVPLFDPDFLLNQNLCIEDWKYEQLMAWTSVAHNGSFSDVIFPRDMTGRDLLELDTNSIAALFARALRQARVDREGDAWTVENDLVQSQERIARRLKMALSMENAAIQKRMKDSKQNSFYL